MLVKFWVFSGSYLEALILRCEEKRAGMTTLEFFSELCLWEWNLSTVKRALRKKGLRNVIQGLQFK